jgi:hypothetical protein
MNSIKEFKKAIEFLEKWGPQTKLAQIYAFYGNVYMLIGENSKALNLLTMSRKIWENKESPQYDFAKMITLLGIGSISYFRGDYQLALESTKKGLLLARKCNRPTFVHGGLNNLGGIYRELGDWDQALNYLKEALLLTEKFGISILLVGMLDTFFHVYIAKGDFTAAKQIFQKIEQEWSQDKEHKGNNLVYQIDKAILLRTSNRTRDLGIAQDIFKSVAQEEIVQIEMTQLAILNLCEMLLDEFKVTNNDEVLDEFCAFLDKLQEAAEKHHAYPILAETHLLDAKLNMIKFDLKKARYSLTQAQQIAERYGLKRLALKISNEHDQLLQNLEVWEQMKKDNVPMSERLEKSVINDQISIMLKKKPIEIPELSAEEPLILLIMAKSGLPLYTKIFSKDWKISEGLFSGFLSAFNSFSDQIFSEGLDRANFGKFTILMTGLPPFRSCYVYEGHSFLAQQKFSQFNESIQKSEQIWQKLTSADRSGQIIRGDPGGGLGQLVQTIF